MLSRGGSVAYSALIFAAGSLVGPLLWHGASRASEHAMESEFLDCLLLLLWPARLLAMGWGGGATVKEAVYIYGAQVASFVVLGLVVGVVSRSAAMIVGVYWLCLLWLLLLALWSAGFESSDVSWPAVFVAGGLYALPFWIVTRAAAREASGQRLQS